MTAPAPQPASPNQCDGCLRGLPIANGLHNGGPGDLIGCTAHLYASIAPAQPDHFVDANKKVEEVPMPEPLSWSDLSIAEGPAYSLAQLRAYGDARALAAVREPLSDGQIRLAAGQQAHLPWGIGSRWIDALNFARAIEAAHGVTAQAQQEGK